MNDPLHASCQKLADELRAQRLKCVFAESCTAGLVAASLATVPGISDSLCGSAVVYRNDTKHQWLRIPQALLDPPGPGPVSPEASAALATAVLESTPEADVSATITGHLGPGAPPELDGLICLAIATRSAGTTAAILAQKSLRLPGFAPEGISIREARQRAAALELLDFLGQSLKSSPVTRPQ